MAVFGNKISGSQSIGSVHCYSKSSLRFIDTTTFTLIEQIAASQNINFRTIRTQISQSASEMAVVSVDN